MVFTDKQAAFIEARVAGSTQEEAACRAGYASNCASVTASKLMKRADIKAAIAKGKRELGTSDAQRHGDGPEKNPLDPWRLKDRYTSPLELMLDVMNNSKAPASLRIQCAKDALTYCHARKEGGKKDDDKSKAKDTASGKFGPGRAPSHILRVA